MKYLRRLWLTTTVGVLSMLIAYQGDSMGLFSSSIVDELPDMRVSEPALIQGVEPLTIQRFAFPVYFTTNATPHREIYVATVCIKNAMWLFNSADNMPVPMVNEKGWPIPCQLSYPPVNAPQTGLTLVSSPTIIMRRAATLSF